MDNNSNMRVDSPNPEYFGNNNDSNGPVSFMTGGNMPSMLSMNVMQNMMSSQNQNSNTSNETATASIICPACNSTVPKINFCRECGAMLPKDNT